MPAYVLIHLVTPTGRATRGAGHPQLSDSVRRAIAAHHGVIVPAARDVTGSATAPAATISVPDMAHADALATALRRLDDVETAYAKPGDELP